MARRSKTYVELEGQEDLRKAFARLELGVLTEVKEVVLECSAEIEAEAKSRVGVLSGETRDSIKTILRDGGIAATIGSGHFNARFEEQGTRHKPARPFLNPAFQLVRPKYLRRVEEAVNRAGRSV